MKVAFSTEGDSPVSRLEPRFGRCSCFLLLDLETGEYSRIDNGGNQDVAQGAGIQAAQTILASGAEALVTGRCGPKALQVLAAAGLPVYMADSGTIEALAEAFRKGTLEPLSAPDGNHRG